MKERIKSAAQKFRNEFKKSVNIAVMSAFGFLIALVWKDVITEFVNRISEQSPISGKLFSAIFITIICVLGIMILTRLFSEKKDGKE
jgi:ACR3 family arsenite efflux pump ArsB